MIGLDIPGVLAHVRAGVPLEPGTVAAALEWCLDEIRRLKQYEPNSLQKCDYRVNRCQVCGVPWEGTPEALASGGHSAVSPDCTAVPPTP